MRVTRARRRDPSRERVAYGRAVPPAPPRGVRSPLRRVREEPVVGVDDLDEASAAEPRKGLVLVARREPVGRPPHREQGHAHPAQLARHVVALDAAPVVERSARGPAPSRRRRAPTSTRRARASARSTRRARAPRSAPRARSARPPSRRDRSRRRRRPRARTDAARSRRGTRSTGARRRRRAPHRARDGRATPAPERGARRRCARRS